MQELPIIEAEFEDLPNTDNRVAVYSKPKTQTVQKTKGKGKGKGQGKGKELTAQAKPIRRVTPNYTVSLFPVEMPAQETESELKQVAQGFVQGLQAFEGILSCMRKLG